MIYVDDTKLKKLKEEYKFMETMYDISPNKDYWSREMFSLVRFTRMMFGEGYAAYITQD